jgi:hypothetical protein
MQKEYDAIITNMAKLLEVQQKRELVAVDMIKAAILAEREACAKVCEEQYEYYGHDHVFAKAIRARGQA